MTGAPTDKIPPLRNHIAMNEPELQRAVDKVGNSAAAVRKELGKAEDGYGTS